MAEESLKDSFLKKLNKIEEDNTVESSEEETEEECVDCDQELTEEEQNEIDFINSLLEEVEKRAGRELLETEIDEIIDELYKNTD
jgi:hypothetical protein